MREAGESAEAVVVKIALERGTERRAEEPRECNQPKRPDPRSGKDIDMRGYGNNGSSPSARGMKTVEAVGSSPVMPKFRDRRKTAQEDAQWREHGSSNG